MSHLDKVKIIERKKITDPRGWFLKVINGHEDNLPKYTGEIYLTSATVGHVKGGHYHIKAHEWFTLIKGCVLLYLQDVESEEQVQIEINADVPSTVYIPPMVAHSVVNISRNEDFILLAYTDQLYDPRDTLAYNIDEMR